LLEEVLKKLNEIQQSNRDIDLDNLSVEEIKAKISDINDNVLSIKSILNID